MIFSTFEILLCLAPIMAFIGAIGLSLVAQNLTLDRRQKLKGTIGCPHCRKRLNPEAYICRFCHKDLYDHTLV